MLGQQRGQHVSRTGQHVPRTGQPGHLSGYERLRCRVSAKGKLTVTCLLKPLSH